MSKAMTNMSLFAIALVINKSISLLMLPVLPHFLTPEQMGKLELLTTFGVVTTLLVSFALHEALYRFVGVRKRTKKNRFSQPTLFIVGADRRRGGCDSPVTDCVDLYS